MMGMAKNNTSHTTNVLPINISVAFVNMPELCQKTFGTETMAIDVNIQRRFHANLMPVCSGMFTMGLQDDNLYGMEYAAFHWCTYWLNSRLTYLYTPQLKIHSSIPLILHKHIQMINAHFWQLSYSQYFILHLKKDRFVLSTSMSIYCKWIMNNITNSYILYANTLSRNNCEYKAFVARECLAPKSLHDWLLVYYTIK